MGPHGTFHSLVHPIKKCSGCYTILLSALCTAFPWFFDGFANTVCSTIMKTCTIKTIGLGLAQTVVFSTFTVDKNFVQLPHEFATHALPGFHFPVLRSVISLDELVLPWMKVWACVVYIVYIVKDIKLSII